MALINDRAMLAWFSVLIDVVGNPVCSEVSRNAAHESSREPGSDSPYSSCEAKGSTACGTRLRAKPCTAPATGLAHDLRNNRLGRLFLNALICGLSHAGGAAEGGRRGTSPLRRRGQ